MTAPILVIGGGLAGAAAACQLACAGHAVELIERTTTPHDKICGEFLSREAQADLRQLGIEPEALGAVPITQLRLIDRTRTVTRPLPFQALSLSRRVLDEALLAQAARLGVIVRRGVTARGLQAESGIARPIGDDRAEPRTIILATGKHTLRGAARNAQTSGLIGFKMYFRLAEPGATRLASTVELHLFAGGYAGLEPVESGRANLTLLVPEATYAAKGADWPTLLAALHHANPSLAAVLAGAEPLLPRPLTIAGIPYGFVHRPDPADACNVYRVGDQLAVIPSLTGDGMAMALRSGIEAAAAITQGIPPITYHAHHAAARRRQMRTAGLVAATLKTAWGRAAVTRIAAAMPSLIDTAVRRTRVA
jgi:flavin-dependent dehydrogenase